MKFIAKKLLSIDGNIYIIMSDNSCWWVVYVSTFLLTFIIY